MLLGSSSSSNNSLSKTTTENKNSNSNSNSRQHQEQTRQEVIVLIVFSVQQVPIALPLDGVGAILGLLLGPTFRGVGVLGRCRGGRDKAGLPFIGAGQVASMRLELRVAKWRKYARGVGIDPPRTAAAMTQVTRLRRELEVFRSGSEEIPDPQRLLGQMVREHFVDWLLEAVPLLRDPGRREDLETLLYQGIVATVFDSGLSGPVLQLVNTRGQWEATFEAAMGAASTVMEGEMVPGRAVSLPSVASSSADRLRDPPDARGAAVLATVEVEENEGDVHTAVQGASARVVVTGPSYRRLSGVFFTCGEVWEILVDGCDDLCQESHELDGWWRLVSNASCFEVYEGYVSNTSRRGKEGLIVSGRHGWQTLKVGGAPLIDTVAGKLVEAWREKVSSEQAQQGRSVRIVVTGPSYRRVPGVFFSCGEAWEVLADICDDLCQGSHKLDGRWKLISSSSCFEVYEGYVSNTSRRGKEGLIVSGRNGWQKRKVGGTPLIDIVAGKLVEAWKENVAFEEAQVAGEDRSSAVVLGRKRPAGPGVPDTNNHEDE